MYKIIGVDQKEYGPISAQQMREWFIQGRVNAQTLVWSETTSNWQPLGNYPEFADLARSSPPPLGAPLAGFGMDPEAARRVALERVSGPAIGLMVTAVFGFLMAFSGFFIKGIVESMAASNPDLQKLAEQMGGLGGGAFGIAGAVFTVAVSLFIFFGGLKMKRLENHGMCVAASWVAIIPCISSCCGIWAVVTLGKPEVKSQFE
jgi:hypothetical protein